MSTNPSSSSTRIASLNEFTWVNVDEILEKFLSALFSCLSESSFFLRKIHFAWANLVALERKMIKLYLNSFNRSSWQIFKLTQNATNSKTFGTFFHRKQPTLKPNRYVFIRIASRSHGKIGLWAHLIIYDLWILQSENRLAKHLGSDIHVQK